MSHSTSLRAIAPAVWSGSHRLVLPADTLGSRAFGRLAATLLVTQAIVLASVISHGWFYTDDFALLMQASHRTPGWNYLKTPINDHLLPGLRLEFWLLRHTAPLNHPLTVAVRLLMQAGGTALLLLLLRTLLGRRRRVLLVTALYAFCPLVLTNSLWLTVALSLLPAQIFVLGALNAHVRYSVTGRIQWAVVTGLCLLGGALFWEKAAVSAVLLPILSVGYLHDGTLGHRLAATVRLWRGWLLTAAPIAAFTAYFAAAGYGGAATVVHPGDLLSVLWLQWSRLVSPSLFGGPWSWLKLPAVPLGFASATTVVAILTQLGFAILVLLGLRLTGWKSLLAWTIPTAPLVLGTSLVATGRFASFGKLIATTVRYGADLAAPLFLGLALAITPASAAMIRRRLDPARADEPAVGQPAVGQPAASEAAGDQRSSDSPVGDRLVEGSRLTDSSPRVGWLGGGLLGGGWLRGSRPGSAGRGRRAAVLATGGAAVLWLLGSLLSVADFDRHWSDANPARRYVSTLKSSIADAGPALNLYDTTVPPAVVLPLDKSGWHLSDFLQLTGHVPAFDAPATEPLLANERGALVPAALVPAAVRLPPTGGLCSYLITGAGTFRMPFAKPALQGADFMRIEYLQHRPTTAYVSVEDVNGVQHTPIGGSQVYFAYLVSHVTLRLPVTSVAAVIVRTEAPETQFCIGPLTVGAPFALGASK